MPPKKAVTATSTRGRQTKTKVSEALRAIARPRTSARGAATAAANRPQPPDDTDTNPSIDVDTLGAIIESLPVIQGLDKRFCDLEATMKNNQLSIRSSLVDTFNQIMDRLNALNPRVQRVLPHQPHRPCSCNSKFSPDGHGLTSPSSSQFQTVNSIFTISQNSIARTLSGINTSRRRQRVFISQWSENQKSSPSAQRCKPPSRILALSSAPG